MDVGCAAAFGRDLIDRLAAGVIDDVDDDDCRTLTREQQRCLASDTAAAAGDEGDLVLRVS